MSSAGRDARIESWLRTAVWVVSLLYLVVWLTNVVACSLQAAYDFHGAPADGPFQLLNPLRRLAAGQVAGRDFQFFHGILVPFLHYPLFAMLGHGLLGSEFARQFVSPVATFLGLLVAWRWITGVWRDAVVLTAVSVAMLEVSMADTLYAALSLLPVRTIFPVLACAALALRGAPWRSGLLCGALTAVSLLSGTEHGAALLMAGGLVLGLEWLWRRTIAARQRLLGAMIGFGLALPALLLAVTHGSSAGALKILQFNVAEIGEDQLWYFGADPGDWLSNRHMLLGWPYPWAVTLLVLAPLVLLGWKRWKSREHLDGDEQRVGLIDAGLVFALYGLITLVSLLGLYISKNVHTCTRSACCLALGLAYFGLWKRTRGTSGGWFERFPPWTVSAGFIGTLVFALAIPRPEKPLQATLKAVVSNVKLARADLTSGARLSSEWTSVLETFGSVLATKKDPVLWSTYAGMPEARWGLFHPDTDYIIHVLGHERRRRYLEHFDEVQPDFVQTQNGSEIYQFEGWLQSTSWPLYDRLLRRYIPVATTFHSLIWRKRLPSDPAVVFGPTSALKVGHDNTIALPPLPSDPGSAEPRVAVVHLNYRVTNSLKWLPMLGRSTHVTVTIQDAWDIDRVPLNPGATEVSFPVHLRPSQEARLVVKPEGILPGTSIEVEAADVTYLSLPAPYAPFATSGLRKKPAAQGAGGLRLATQSG